MKNIFKEIALIAIVFFVGYVLFKIESAFLTIMAMPFYFKGIIAYAENILEGENL